MSGNTLNCEQDVLQIVERLSNQVHDPCALGVGLQIGMADMGLIKKVEAKRSADEGWSVKVIMRFTAPDCMNFFYFKQNLERNLLEVEGISEAVLDFSEEFDWSHDLMSEGARLSFEEHTDSWRRRSLRGERAFPIAPE